MNVLYLKQKLVFSIQTNKMPFNLIKYGNIYRHGSFNSNMCWESITEKYTNEMCWNGSNLNCIWNLNRFFNKPNISYIIEDYDETKTYYSLIVSCVYRDITFGIFEGINNLLESGINAIKQNMNQFESYFEKEEKFREMYNNWTNSGKDGFSYIFNQKTDMKIYISKM